MPSEQINAAMLSTRAFIHNLSLSMANWRISELSMCRGQSWPHFRLLLSKRSMGRVDTIAVNLRVIESQARSILQQRILVR